MKHTVRVILNTELGRYYAYENPIKNIAHIYAAHITPLEGKYRQVAVDLTHCQWLPEYLETPFDIEA